MRSFLGWIVAACLIGSPVAAGAAEVFTPTLQRDGDTTDDFACRVLNVGKRRIAEVEVRILDGFGGGLNAGFDALAPGRSFSIQAPEFPGSGTNPVAYCRVSGRFPKRSVRVTFCVRASQGCTAAVSAP
jgi:hypothetical protein